MRSVSEKIGLFGGTFDPVHIGHLILATEAFEQLGLDRILLIPAADPPHKQGQRISSVTDRIRMLQLAIAPLAYLEISRVDVDRPGPHFTIDTLRILRECWGKYVELFFLMGLDSLRDLPTWHQPQQLGNVCRLVAFERAGVSIDWHALEQAIPGLKQQVTLLEMPELEISGSTIRRRLEDCRSIRFWVPDPVRAYIYDHALYRNKLDG